jgi:hypothetical protein
MLKPHFRLRGKLDTAMASFKIAGIDETFATSAAVWMCALMAGLQPSPAS